MIPPFSMSARTQEIIRSYRTLYRQGLHAVQYATPARYTLKTLIENHYRAGNAADFDPRKIENTRTFLQGATKDTGLEHRILKNLLHTWWWEGRNKRFHGDNSPKVIARKKQQSKAALDHFEITLKMLNESMGMCLPTRLITNQEVQEVHARRLAELETTIQRGEETLERI